MNDVSRTKWALKCPVSLYTIQITGTQTKSFSLGLDRIRIITILQAMISVALPLFISPVSLILPSSGGGESVGDRR